MNKEQAYYIAYLRAGPIMHSWRRIAELVHENYPELCGEDLSGNQLHGDDLCRDALKLIYNLEDWRKNPNLHENVWAKIMEKWCY